MDIGNTKKVVNIECSIPFLPYQRKAMSKTDKPWYSNNVGEGPTMLEHWLGRRQHPFQQLQKNMTDSCHSCQLQGCDTSSHSHPVSTQTLPASSLPPRKLNLWSESICMA
mmetsp:Transcript_26317/g.64154  ORF Transcript_26317/g.64154 Transcript_26317/m.64154 type:complete len:110 (+) Transcript_26317:128-457(+)